MAERFEERRLVKCFGILRFHPASKLAGDPDALRMTATTNNARASATASSRGDGFI